MLLNIEDINFDITLIGKNKPKVLRVISYPLALTMTVKHIVTELLYST
jgi:hypothetical protein